MSVLLLVCFEGFTFPHPQKQHGVSRGIGQYLCAVASVPHVLNILCNACDPGVAPLLGMEAQVLLLLTQLLASLAQVQLSTEIRALLL